MYIVKGAMMMVMIMPFAAFFPSHPIFLRKIAVINNIYLADEILVIKSGKSAT